MDATEQLVTILAQGTMRAAALICQDKGIKADAEKLTVALRSTLAANLDVVMQEWRELVEARMGEAMTRHALNVQCNHLALKAIQSAGYL